MIYADNAATTQLDNDALQAMLPFLQEKYGNISQPYSFSRSSKKDQADLLLLLLIDNVSGQGGAFQLSVFEKRYTSSTHTQLLKLAALALCTQPVARSTQQCNIDARPCHWSRSSWMRQGTAHAASLCFFL